MERLYTDDKALEEIQNKIVNQILVLICLLGSLVVLLSFARTEQGAFRLNSYVHATVLLIFTLVTVIRKKLSARSKILVILTTLGVDIFFSIYSGGYLASAKILLAVIPVFISFIFPFRKAVYSLFILLVIYAIMGYFFISGVFLSEFDAERYSVDSFAWAFDCAVILFSSYGLLYIGKEYNNTLLENTLLIKSQSTEILDREKKYETLFHSSNDAILLFQDQVFVDCNVKSLELFGCDREDLIGKNPVEFSPQHQPDGQESAVKAKRLLQATYQGSPQQFEWVHSRLDGQPFDALISLSQVVLDNTTYVQAVIRDITRQKQIERELLAHQEHLEKLVEERTTSLERTNKQLLSANSELQSTLDELQKTQAQLIESEKLASIGVLTAGVGHEINNPLNFIYGGLYKLKDTFEYSHEYDAAEREELRKESIRVIDTGVSRIRDIVKSLNHFNRTNDQALEPCNVHVVLDNCINILNHELKDLEVKKSYVDDGLFVLGNEGKLHQVFLNLIHNASQSIQGAGSVEIITGIRSSDDVGYVTIKDTGAGIPSSEISKVFDPFYTTKPPGEGVGLGLFIVYQIIKELNGKIKIESKEGSGTLITVSFQSV
ncbi:PAS domain-containing sensor histidine kinase [Marinoscillum sp.]|uniref:PAS domain-containing sensor histidine kinase n=1 Tax=Marinoscillum sp. TaxID=2024838 RepID=UPI003BAD1026